MTPKEKAQQLADYYMPFCSNNYNDAKQCALITVDEILLHEKENHSILDKSTEYWREVKKEIEAL